MKFRYTLFLIVELLTSGCDTFHSKQYRIKELPPGSPEVVRLKLILQNVADQTGMIEDHQLATNNLAFYTREDLKDVNIPILSAWFYEGDVFVELFSGGFGTPPPYRKLKRLIKPALRQEFGSRVSDSERNVHPSEGFHSSKWK